MTESAPKTASSPQGQRSSDTKTKPEIEIIHRPSGVDVPVVGHVSYRSLGLYGGLAVAGTVGVLEWPVAVAVGVAYGLTRK